MCELLLLPAFPCCCLAPGEHPARPSPRPSPGRSWIRSQVLLQLSWAIKQAHNQVIFLAGICAPDSLCKTEPDLIRPCVRAVLWHKVLLFVGKQTQARETQDMYFHSGWAVFPWLETSPACGPRSKWTNRVPISGKLLGYHSRGELAGKKVGL